MIKKIYLSALLLLGMTPGFTQVTKIRNLGRAAVFTRTISQATQVKNAAYVLPAPSGEDLNGIVNNHFTNNGRTEIVGEAGKKGTFTLSTDASGMVTGTYHSILERRAFQYYTDGYGNLIAKEVAIESLICMDYSRLEETSYGEAQHAAKPLRTTAIPRYSSKPGSKYVIYIDLDGETIASSHWAGGKTIYAQPLANWTDSDVELIWEVAAQDYLIYDVNVTTDRAVFDAADICQRKMCIVTSTLDAADGQSIGGIAWIGSFDECTKDPCWVFNKGGKVTGETVSHEVGHTVDLNHDGNSSSAYYTGHNNWAPIMGAAYSTGSIKLDNPNVMGQWSAGEYNGANNGEDDIVIIGTHNGFGFRPDEVGDTYTAAGKLTVESDGKVLGEKNQGIIGRRKDLDVYKFTCGSGDVTLTAAPYLKTPDLNKHPNLNIKLRLLNASGTELLVADPVPPSTANTFAAMAATITKTGLAAGTYYLEIDGVGNGSNASSGYTDYGSLGGYNISGTVPLATGIDDEQIISQFNIFPNPSNGTFNITFNTAIQTDYKMEVVNALGQKVYGEILTGFKGGFSGQLLLQQFGKGIYMVSIGNNNNQCSKRVVVY